MGQGKRPGLLRWARQAGFDTGKADDGAPIEPKVLPFFAPAILALVLQHMAVTLAAISTVRERLGGTMETLRVSPIHPIELVVGRYLAYALFNLAVAGALTLLIIGPLGIPLLAPVWLFLGLLALLSFTSLGLGLLIAAVADSEH